MTTPHDTETFSASLAYCERLTPVMRSFDVFCVVSLRKPMDKQSVGWWFLTLWRSWDITLMVSAILAYHIYENNIKCIFQEHSYLPFEEWIFTAYPRHHLVLLEVHMLTIWTTGPSLHSVVGIWYLRYSQLMRPSSAPRITLTWWC